MTTTYLGSEEWLIFFDDNEKIVISETNIMELVRGHREMLRTEGEHMNGTILDKQKKE